MPSLLRRWRDEDDREDVESRDGVVTLNRLQQHPENFDPPLPATPVEEAETTDPHDITDGAFGD